jgi:hypothetical protein
LILKSKAVEVGIFIPPKLSTFRPPVTQLYGGCNVAHCQ